MGPGIGQSRPQSGQWPGFGFVPPMMKALGPSRFFWGVWVFFILRFFHHAMATIAMMLRLIEQMEKSRSALKTVQNIGLSCIYFTFRHIRALIYHQEDYLDEWTIKCLIVLARRFSAILDELLDSPAHEVR